MPDHEFLFALRLCEDGRFEELLRELTARVLGFVGCPAGDTAEVSDQLLAGLTQCETEGLVCQVQFLARDGEIEVVLSAGDRRLFRTSRHLP